ncbi:DUF1641 domain-containing protein [Aquibacillus sp. 3ASR75-11]|uniref:DUF1641 domain-containing protein n=1 Tax=Terrihalobacillus insolitus TaxID=2950438 RepID=A0A9X3WWY2_9BACI|nr:DUF1641 domain-containing protein [Terrihalobacillus insolitus]MDC3413240.1 DUF1641 domain-containing protein [Terrihalobacillus insolitus]MDC3425706.1 DUF1641 domain-containing protein [Terrihalobacillus insolitus]
MASPISDIKRMELSEADVHKQNLDEVTKAVSDNKEAILKGIDLLATINKSGTLDMVNAFVKHKEEALENVMGELNKPQYSATLENLSKLFFFAGELNVDEIQYFSEKLNHGMEVASTMEDSEKTSYMELFKALKDPEINRSITMLLKFLRGMGK